MGKYLLQAGNRTLIVPSDQEDMVENRRLLAVYGGMERALAINDMLKAQGFTMPEDLYLVIKDYYVTIEILSLIKELTEEFDIETVKTPTSPGQVRKTKKYRVGKE